ncbi:50S ribosomal protein L9 [Azospirillum halopraeferens]|uniref:50S ribosomal protein L9 n=1 Tax=Azospirillum halopraeferens TaxID=34010 RepID=UPI000405E080|nr:50S ribosomal protein L9 [Azospirillum halopraeferens]
MEVILLERVEKLGQMGQVVKVRAGFARNYLLPQKKALRATKTNLEYFQKQRASLEAANLERRKDAEYVAQKVDGVAVVITRQAGETGVLYGSVSSRDIADALTAAGFSVERQQVSIDQPIKTLGLFRVRIVLHPEVSVHVTVNVARSAEEAELQAQRGGMITAADLLDEEEEREAAEAAAARAEETEET